MGRLCRSFLVLFAYARARARACEVDCILMCFTSRFLEARVERISSSAFLKLQIGLLSWNVGGISDHRKDQGAGLEEARVSKWADPQRVARGRPRRFAPVPAFPALASCSI